MSEMFNLGFGPDQPTPQELTALPSQVAILQGTRQGLAQKATSTAHQLIAAPMTLADQIVGAMIEPANDAVGSISSAKTAISAVGQQAALNAIQGPLAQAMAWGYQSRGTPLLGGQQPTKKRKRARRKASSQLQTPTPAPIVPMSQSGGAGQTAAPLAAGGAVAGTGCASLVLASPTMAAQLQYVIVAPTDSVGQYTSIGFPVLGSYPSLAAGMAAASAYVASAQAANPTWGTMTGATVVAWPDTSFDCEGASPGPPITSAPGGSPPLPPVNPIWPGGLQPPLPPVNPIWPGGLQPPGQPGGAVFPTEEECCQDVNVAVNVPPPQMPPVNIQIQEKAPVINISIPTATLLNTPPGSPVPGVVVITPPPQPAPTVNVTTPPVDVTVVTPPVNVDVSCPGGGVAATTAGAGGKPPSSGGPILPIGPCASCSIAWLSLTYPHFVMAERSAMKTDFDILVDAITLKLCCGEVPKLPGCSMPYLERIFPEFVIAAKAQGLIDDEVLQQAVNIGLCADEPVSSGLGEGNVGYIAPDSALELSAEFDPPVSGEAGAVPTIGGKPVAPSLPNATAKDAATPHALQPIVADDPFKCLAGLAKPMQQFTQLISQFIASECNVKPGSFSQRIDAAAQAQWDSQSIVGKATATVLWTVDRVWNWLCCSTVDAANGLSKSTGCDAGALASSFVAQVMVGVVNKWIVNVPDSVTGPLQQVINTACPYRQITSDAADALRARNFIDATTWQCIVRANGDIEDQHGAMMLAAMSSPNDADLLQRYRWLEAVLSTGTLAGKPLDPKTAASYIAEQKYIHSLWSNNGWGDPERLLEWQKTQRWVPSTSDAIEWMLKDTQDQQIQTTFLLDAEFAQKYNGRVQQAFDQNAVSKEDAQTIWKAHWRNMAPHQLYEMHKRLRPGWTATLGNGDVNAFVDAICPRKPVPWPPVGGDVRPVSNGFKVPTYCDELVGADQRRAWLESLVTTGYHVSEALGQDDYPAFWRQRLIALSYNVMTRVDARRAYEIGKLTDAQLTAIMMDRGYKISDAEALVAFARQQLVLKFARSPTAKEWIAFPYQIQLLQQNFVADGMRVDLWNDVYTILQIKLGVKQKITQLKQAKRNVTGGRMNAAAAQQQVANILKGGR